MSITELREGSCGRWSSDVAEVVILSPHHDSYSEEQMMYKILREHFFASLNRIVSSFARISSRSDRSIFEWRVAVPESETDKILEESAYQLFDGDLLVSRSWDPEGGTAMDHWRKVRGSQQASY